MRCYNGNMKRIANKLEGSSRLRRNFEGYTWVYSGYTRYTQKRILKGVSKNNQQHLIYFNSKITKIIECQVIKVIKPIPSQVDSTECLGEATSTTIPTTLMQEQINNLSCHSAKLPRNPQ